MASKRWLLLWLLLPLLFFAVPASEVVAIRLYPTHIDARACLAGAD
jgi:hypothetical protein